MSDLNTGPCCACGRTGDSVRNFICTGLLLPAQYRGRRVGAGCLACGQPTDEAVAVICDDCLGPPLAEIKEIYLGGELAGQRIPYADLPGQRVYHDIAGHPEIWPPTATAVGQVNGSNTLIFADSPDPGPACPCSLCVRPIERGPVIRMTGPDDREIRLHPDCAEHLGITRKGA